MGRGPVHPKTLELKRVRWSPRVAKLLSTVQLDPSYLATWKRDVAHRCAWLLGVFAGGQMIGVVLLRRCVVDGDKTLIIDAAAGGLPGVDLVQSVLPTVGQLAAGDGYSAVEFHTARLGLARKTILQGYEFREVIMRKAVGHG